MSAYLLAKIRGKLSRILTAREIDALKKARLAEIIERLSSTNYAGPLKAGEKGMSDLLRAGLFNDLQWIFFSLEGEERRLILDILARYRAENMKTLVRAKLHQIPEERVEGMILQIPWEKVDYARLLALPSIEAVINGIPWPRYRTRLEGVLRQIGEPASPFAYETAIDDVYLETLIEHYTRQGKSVKEILKNRLLREIICWAFRLKGYGRSFPEIINLLPDFRPLLAQQELRAIVEEEGGWRRIARLLDSESASELDGSEGFDPRLIDPLFDRRLIRLAKREMITDPLGLGVTVGYVYLKEIELNRLIGAVGKAKGKGDVHNG